MKKLTILLMITVLLATLLCGCGTKIVHCDKCGKEITVGANSNVTEDWILYCDECGDPALHLFEEK